MRTRQPCKADILSRTDKVWSKEIFMPHFWVENRQIVTRNHFCICIRGNRGVGLEGITVILFASFSETRGNTGSSSEDLSPNSPLVLAYVQLSAQPQQLHILLSPAHTVVWRSGFASKFTLLSAREFNIDWSCSTNEIGFCLQALKS